MPYALAVWTFCGLSALAWAGSRTTLKADTQIQGYSCAKGYAFFYESGALEACKVSRETAFGEIRVPEHSMIYLQRDGRPNFVFLGHDARILGMTCRGGGHSYMTGLYPGGKLKVCWLAGDQDVQGVPCMGAGFFADVFGGGVGTFFYEDGNLRTCKLSRDYGRLRKGDHIVLPQVPGA